MGGLIFASIIMVVISYQDLKDRSIHWITIPLLFLSLLWWQDFSISALVETVKNLLFILVILFFLTVYVSFKHRSYQNITESYFGWGDILFLLAITPAFSNQVFMLFFIGCTIVVLIISLILMKMTPTFEVIPYAGLFALLLNGFLLFSTFINDKALLYLESNFFLIE
tara:strand:- start:181437 stop:181940 length:504 start_codon:yes stop_codon:yes gene_type:complete